MATECFSWIFLFCALSLYLLFTVHVTLFGREENVGKQGQLYCTLHSFSSFPYYWDLEKRRLAHLSLKLTLWLSWYQFFTALSKMFMYFHMLFSTLDFENKELDFRENKILGYWLDFLYLVKLKGVTRWLIKFILHYGNVDYLRAYFSQEPKASFRFILCGFIVFYCFLFLEFINFLEWKCSIVPCVFFVCFSRIEEMLASDLCKSWVTSHMI